MPLTWIDIHNVRGIAHATLEPAAGLNIIAGGNGSGKTSLLEAFYLISTGRSFTQSQFEHVLRRAAVSLRVVARLVECGREQVVGLERRPGVAPEVHLGGSRIDGIARLAELLPAQAIHPRSDELVSGGPGQRRRFVDWGVFHVKQSFIATWREYQRALHQRNAALRGAPSAADLMPWNRILARAGETIATQRAAYLAQLQPSLSRLAASLFQNADIELQLHRGWSTGSDLQEVLERSYERDRRQGTTGAGPHRAELRIRLDGDDARATASRGQQKLLVYALKLAQIEHLQAVRQRQTLLLIDDLPSELDAGSRERVLALLRDYPGQVVMTALERAQLDSALSGSIAKMFHVEQGAVEELVY